MHVYVNEDRVVLYGEWPVEPTTVIIKTPRVMGGKTINHTLRQNYQKALKKAIEEAVPFEDQVRVKGMIVEKHWTSVNNWILKPGFYDIQAEVKIKSTPCKDGDYNCEDGCWGSNTGCQWPNKVAVIKPLSSGEKEELFVTDEIVNKMMGFASDSPKRHGTILIGWDNSGEVIYARTFDFDDTTTTERDQALAALEKLTKQTRHWQFGSVKSVLHNNQFIKENLTENE